MLSKMKTKICIVLAIGLLANYTMFALASDPFYDITGHPAEEAILYCAQKGYVIGFPGGTFKPDGYVTEAQLKVLSAAYLSENQDGNRTVALSSIGQRWYDAATHMLYNLGVIKTSELSNPNEALSKLTIEQSLAQIFEHNANDGGVLNFSAGDVDRLVSRAELCTMIKDYESRQTAQIPSGTEHNASGLRAISVGNGHYNNNAKTGTVSLPDQGLPADESEKILSDNFDTSDISAIHAEDDRFGVTYGDNGVVLNGKGLEAGDSSMITLRNKDGATSQFTAFVTDGSKEHPHIIASAGDLAQIENLGLHLNYRQVADIDMQGYAHTPIGSFDAPFTGVYDGQSYEIAGLNLVMGEKLSGIFGVVGSNGIVKDIGLVTAKLSAPGTALIENTNQYTGAVAAVNHGVIDNCNTKATIEYNGNNAIIGAVAGYNQGIIRNLSSEGEFRTSNMYGQTGGICGLNEGTIEGSYASVTGYFSNAYNNVGGITAYNLDGEILSCEATLVCSANGDNNAIGGLSATNDYGYITDCYADVAINARGNHVYVGGIAAGNNAGVIQSSYVKGSFVLINALKGATGGIAASNNAGGLIKDCEVTGKFKSDALVIKTGAVAGENLAESLIMNCITADAKINADTGELKVAGVNLGDVE